MNTAFNALNARARPRHGRRTAPHFNRLGPFPASQPICSEAEGVYT
ncbi:MAG: hypothetical protein WCD13_01795 [Pseudolabrys sp.]